MITKKVRESTVYRERPPMPSKEERAERRAKAAEAAAIAMAEHEARETGKRANMERLRAEWLAVQLTQTPGFQMTSETPYLPSDPDLVEFTDKAGLEYWMSELGCSRDALFSAVQEVGNHVKDVRSYLILKPI